MRLDELKFKTTGEHNCIIPLRDGLRIDIRQDGGNYNIYFDLTADGHYPKPDEMEDEYNEGGDGNWWQIKSHQDLEPLVAQAILLDYLARYGKDAA